MLLELELKKLWRLPGSYVEHSNQRNEGHTQDDGRKTAANVFHDVILLVVCTRYWFNAVIRDEGK